jgi:tripartite-type tricarboxylate transporter receptor subunit TctC
MDRRSFVIGTAACASILLTGPGTAQEAFPSHPVTIINPYPPGGANDVVTRPLAAALETALNKPVVIETKAGAAGQVGAQFTANAKPDGYTLMTHNTSLSGGPEVDRLYGRAPKYTNASFIPLARVVADPCVFVVNDKQPYKTFKEFSDDAKKRPNQIVFSTAGFYSAVHIPMALLMKGTGLELRHLPTNGGGPAMTALLGNNANVAILSLSGTLAQIKAGKLRPLAMFGGKRSAAIPDVPTMKELGFDLEYYLWVGIFAPKGTPDNAVKALREALGKAANSDQYKKALGNMGLELAYLDRPDFEKFWDMDAKRVVAAVNTIGRAK